MTSKFMNVEINTEYKFYVATLCIVIYTLMKPNWFFRRDTYNIQTLKWTWFPYLFAITYSILLIIVGQTTFHYVWRGISFALHILVAFVFAHMVLDKYKSNTIHIVCNAMLLSFVYTLIMGIWGLGFQTAFEYFLFPGNFGTSVSGWFEMHDLIFSMGFMIIYMLFFSNQKENKRTFKILLLLVFFYIGYKRIAILGLILSIVLGLFVSSRNKYRKIEIKKIVLVLLCVLCCCYIYTFMLSTGVFELLSLKYNINLMGRDRIYSVFKDYYNYSLSFLGNGYGFTNQFLLDNVENLYRQLYGTLGLHNDILKTYIELGFFGSLVWHFSYLVYIPMKIQKMDFSIIKLYLMIMIYSYIVFLTDNTTQYFWFQFTWGLLLWFEIRMNNDYIAKKSKNQFD